MARRKLINVESRKKWKVANYGPEINFSCFYYLQNGAQVTTDCTITSLIGNLMFKVWYLSHKLPRKFNLRNLLPYFRYVAYGTCNSFGKTTLNFSKEKIFF